MIRIYRKDREVKVEVRYKALADWIMAFSTIDNTEIGAELTVKDLNDSMHSKLEQIRE